MKDKSAQRDKKGFTKGCLSAITDIFEMGTTLLIGVILGIVISGKGIFKEALLIVAISVVFIIYSVYLRTEKVVSFPIINATFR